MTAIRLGRERLTAVSNGFADLISDTGGSTPAIPNGFLNGSVFGNDMGSLSAHYTGRLLNNRGAVQFGLPPGEHLVWQRRELLVASVPQFGRHTGKPRLFAFGSFVLVRLLDGSLYRCETRVGAQGGLHVA